MPRRSKAAANRQTDAAIAAADESDAIRHEKDES
jgi:hypothetical protein